MDIVTKKSAASSAQLAEQVFAIDNIMESVFSKLKEATLFNCRFVCRRWAHFAAKALQKMTKLTVTFDADNISALVDLINNSPEFPFASFTFSNSNNNVTPALEPFFNAHASRVEKLDLEGYFSADDLKQLIFTLASNVKELHLDDVYMLEDNASDSGSSTGPGPVLKNLKIIKCEHLRIPETIIRQILESSPNLVEASVHHRNLQFLAQPRNMLHAVTRIEIDLDRCFGVDSPYVALASLQLVANNPLNNWAVKEFECHGYLDLHSGNNAEIEQIIADILGQILLGCSGSCTRLVLGEIPNNFKIFQMPKVKHVTFSYKRSSATGQRVRDMFPPGASLADLFPNLRSLRIFSEYNMSNVPIANIIGGVGGQPPVPNKNVQDVTLNFRRTGKELEKSFREMFPNAKMYI